MKIHLWLAVTAMIVFAPLSHAETVVVVETPQSSTQRPTISVVYEGKPVHEARLHLYRFSSGIPKWPPEDLHYKLTANRHGQLILPRLPWGIYRLTASSRPNLKGEIFLSMAPPSNDPSYTAFELNLISSWGNSPRLKEASAFSLKLGFYPTPEQILAQEERLPVTKIAAFQGSVFDLSGAYIPHASIAVTRMDTPGKKHTRQLKADAQGKFAANLPAGDYIATFSSQGFRTGVLHLKIARGASNHPPLQIKLQVGESST